MYMQSDGAGLSLLEPELPFLTATDESPCYYGPNVAPEPRERRSRSREKYKTSTGSKLINEVKTKT